MTPLFANSPIWRPSPLLRAPLVLLAVGRDLHLKVFTVYQQADIPKAQVLPAIRHEEVGPPAFLGEDKRKIKYIFHA